MGDVASEETTRFFKEVSITPEYKASHAASLLTVQEKNEALDREKVRKDPEYQYILDMRRYKQIAVRFYKSHGPNAIEFMPDHIFAAYCWEDSPYVAPTVTNKNNKVTKS